MTVDRLRREARFHDAQARERARFFSAHPEALRFADEDYLDHETWMRPALDALGDVGGMCVLDCGCGHGMMATILARRGADVIACDLSAGYLAEAQRRASANGARVRFVAADAQRLPFADGTFHAIWGNAVLHHLDIARAAAEIKRLLRPGGRAVFCEPWGGNPVLDLARRHLPYPGKGRTPDETPLRSADVRTLERFFPGLRLRGFQLLSMARRLLPSKPRLAQRLSSWDARLLRLFPGLERFCRYAVLVLPRQP